MKLVNAAEAARLAHISNQRKYGKQLEEDLDDIFKVISDSARSGEFSVDVEIKHLELKPTIIGYLENLEYKVTSGDDIISINW